MTPPGSDDATGELEQAELELQAAVLAGDADALAELLDDEVLYTGPDGSVVGKVADLEAHRSGLLDVRRFDVRSASARVIGDTGLTFIEADLAGTAGDQEFSAHLRYTRAWHLTDGSWRVVAAHASAVV